MKLISEYLDGIEPGEVVPSIKGIIIKIVPPSSKGIQYITIANPGLDEDDVTADDFIKLAISEDKWVAEPEEGNVLSIVSTAQKKQAAKGMVLKEGKNGKFISVTSGASIEQSEYSVTESPAEEPMTAADSAIDNYILDRLYIYGRCKRIVEQLDDSLPFDKLPELATAVHIALERRNMAPRPDDNQENRKKVHKERQGAVAYTPKGGMAPEESDKREGVARNAFRSDWRNFKNPVSGVLLGSEGVDKIKEVYLPWSYRQNPDSIEKGPRGLLDMVNEAARELKITPADSLQAYTLKYIKDYEPNSQKRRDTILNKFMKGLEEEKIVVDSTEITDKEAIHLLNNFRDTFEEIIETDDDEE